METENQRFERYLETSGFWFSSSPGMDEWAREKVKKGELIPINLVPGVIAKCDLFYVYPDSTLESLRKIFTDSFLGTFVDYSI